jgi:predicted DNA-binding transcriptional regulator AlpA
MDEIEIGRRIPKKETIGARAVGWIYIRENRR